MNVQCTIWLHVCTLDSLFVLFCFVLAGLICQKRSSGWCQACLMLSVWVAAGRGWVLHVLPGCGRLWLAVILLPSHVVFRAGAAQQGAAQNRQTGRRPAHKQGRAKLIPVQERWRKRLQRGIGLQSAYISSEELLWLAPTRWMTKNKKFQAVWHKKYSKKAIS